MKIFEIFNFEFFFGNFDGKFSKAFRIFVWNFDGINKLEKLIDLYN